MPGMAHWLLSTTGFPGRQQQSPNKGQSRGLRALGQLVKGSGAQDILFYVLQVGGNGGARNRKIMQMKHLALRLMLPAEFWFF